MKLVLKPTSREMDVRLIASIHSWELIAEYPLNKDTPHQIHWRFGTTTRIVFMDDMLLHMSYLVVDGDNVDVIEKQVIDGLEIYRFSDLQRLRSESLDSVQGCTLANAAALMAPGHFDQDYFDLLASALNSKNPDVQRAAVFAVNYVPWIEFRDIMLNVKDKNPGLARDVDVVVDAIDTHGWRTRESV